MPELDPGLHGLAGPTIHHDPSPAILYEHALGTERDCAIADSGALIAYSGARTGRSPADKRIVDAPESRDAVWWGAVNRPLAPAAFERLREQAVAYLNTCRQVYVIDGFAGASAETRVRVRVICERPYHALFMRNMLIRPALLGETAIGTPDCTIYNAGRCGADHTIDGVSSETSVALNLERGELVILGTEYAGEMKKGVFTLMNHLMPARGVLPMHCSANAGDSGDVALFFGLSGTGKTTLSADPGRALIGDDEHCWGDEGIANIEGGCYAKVIDLAPAAEPQIHGAIRFGAVLENVVFDPATRAVDYADGSITQNTRCAYPADFIDNARLPGRGGVPQRILFLTCDAFSVLPPLSRLTPEQAMYHFISGYTAKVAGTEMGVTEPEATFSACYGAPFLVRHPALYARMLAERIEKSGASVWLVNTGWSGGPYGTGSRIRLRHTRAMLDAIHSGALDGAEERLDPVFGLAVPTACPGVPERLLDPAAGWPDRGAYIEAAVALAGRFRENFTGYAAEAGDAVLAAGPRDPDAIHAALGTESAPA